MVRTTVLLALASLATSCGDDSPQPAQFVEHCGAHEPVRLLALEPDAYWLRTTPLGDRLYHSFARTDADGSPISPITGRQLWSTGLCGESPRHIADDIELIFDAESAAESNPWPDLLLGCQPDTGVVIVDPAGTTPPQLIFPAEFCYGNWTEYGFLHPAVSEDQHSFAYRLYPYPDDPRGGPGEPIVVADGLPLGQFFSVQDSVITVISGDHTLQRIDLADHSTTSIQTGVRDYVFSPDERYLLWMDASTADPNYPTGDLLLRDNETGLSVALGSFSGTLLLHTAWPGEQHLFLDQQDGQARLYHLPDLTFTELPPGARAARIFPDDRLLITTQVQDQWLGIFDPADATFTPLFPRQAQIIGIGDDAAIVLDVPFDSSQRDTAEGKVWSVPFDGSRARLQADRATSQSFRVDDARRITTIDVDDGPRREGTFLLVDTDTRAESRIADHVTQWRIVDYDDPTLLTYTIYDGERTGIWQARLPPTP